MTLYALVRIAETMGMTCTEIPDPNCEKIILIAYMVQEILM